MVEFWKPWTALDAHGLAEHTVAWLFCPGMPEGKRVVLATLRHNGVWTTLDVEPGQDWACAGEHAPTHWQDPHVTKPWEPSDG